MKIANVIHRNYLKSTNSFMGIDYPVKDFIFLRILDLNSHIQRVQKRVLNSNTLSERSLCTSESLHIQIKQPNINNEHDHKHGFLTLKKSKGRNLWYLRSKETWMQQWVSDQQVGQSTADCSHRMRSSLTALPTMQSKKMSIT